jgi:putative intracellular protease/amidase
VVEAAPGHFYLFRTQDYGKDAKTRVYHSTDPMDFGHGALNYVDALHFVTTLPVAAPEIVKRDGQWFIAALRSDLKGIQIAKLDWKTVADVQPKLAAKPDGKAIRVALYDDSGSTGKGIPCVSDQLGALKDVDLVKLDASGIRAGLDGYDAVIFTGGSGGRQANTIGLLGREQVRRFVQRGGGYVGICAGAYLACDGFRWGVKVLDAKTPSPKWERGVASLQIEATPAGRELLGYPAEQVTVTYHNGPLLVPAENPELGDFDPLSYFRTEVALYDSPAGIMVNTPAMVRGTCGKGRVLVSSPHPEQTPGLESFAERAVRWVSARN